MPRHRRLLVALALLAALAAPATAAATADPETIAGALARSPVFVDPAFDAAIPAAQRRELVRRVRGAGRPIYVAFVPIIAGDEYGGEARDFLSVLHDRLGRDGMYLTVHEGLVIHREYGVSYADERRASAASYMIIGEGPRNEAPVAYVERFLTALADPKIVERYREAIADRNAAPLTAGDEPAAEDGDDGGGAGALGPIAFVATIVLGLLAWRLLLRRRRSGARYARDPLPVLPRRVFDNARAAAEEDLREQARAAVVAFAAALDRAPPPADPAAAEHYAIALDASSGASRTLDRAGGVPDLAGVLALVDRGYAALSAAKALAAGKPPPEVTPLCCMNPLHGRSDQVVSWRKGLRIPVCAECARALARGDVPDALRDGQEPYLETETVWARAGYGAFGDDLVQRVARGDR